MKVRDLIDAIENAYLYEYKFYEIPKSITDIVCINQDEEININSTAFKILSECGIKSFSIQENNGHTAFEITLC